MRKRKESNLIMTKENQTTNLNIREGKKRPKKRTTRK
jgi:hypothetical protein